MIARKRYKQLVEERKKLFSLWQNMDASQQRTTILMRISDIDDELEKYKPKTAKKVKHRKFTKSNIKLIIG